VVTAEKSAEIEGKTTAGAIVNEDGHLILTLHNGDEIDAGSVTDIRLHNGTTYAVAEGANVYVGAEDPGTVPDGCIWLDTSS